MYLGTEGCLDTTGIWLCLLFFYIVRPNKSKSTQQEKLLTLASNI